MARILLLFIHLLCSEMKERDMISTATVRRILLMTAGLLSMAAPLAQAQEAAPSCARTITANVVGLDQVFFYNRLGAWNPGGMIFALERDVVRCK